MATRWIRKGNKLELVEIYWNDLLFATTKDPSEAWTEGKMLYTIEYNKKFGRYITRDSEGNIINSKGETKMNNNNFDLEIICQGACIDKDEAEDFLIETKTFRLNHIALNEWTLSEMMNSRECYAAGPAGDEEWREHKSEYTEKRRIATQHIINALNFAKREGSISITQAMAEIFIAVRISRV